MNYCTLDYSMCWWDFARWEMFYDYALGCLKNHKLYIYKNGNDYAQSERYKSFAFGKKLNKFELQWGKIYSEYEYPKNRNVVPKAKYYCKKWNF